MPRFDVADDVLDHHDRIVDDKSGRNAQRHERKIVETEADRRHDAERGDQRHRQRHARYYRRPEFSQEEEYHQHHKPDGDSERLLNVGDGGADSRRAVSGDLKIERMRRKFLQIGQQSFDRVDDLDDIGAGLPLDVEDERRLAVVPSRELVVLERVDGFADILELDRRAFAIRDDRVAKSGGVEQLVVGADLKGLLGPSI